MIRRRVLAVAIATTGLLCLAPEAVAVVHYATTLDATGTSVGRSPSERFIEYGRVHSGNAACRANRKLSLVAHYPNGSTKVLDATTSSLNGAYALVGDFTGSDRGVITAAVKRFGNKGHRRVCNAATISTD